MTYYRVRVIQNDKTYLVETDYEARALRDLLYDIGVIVDIEEIDVSNVHAIVEETIRELEEDLGDTIYRYNRQNIVPINVAPKEVQGYVLISQMYEEYTIHGVFFSKEEAEEEMKRIGHPEKTPWGRVIYYDDEKMELDIVETTIKGKNFKKGE